ncbi:MAG: phosphodiester glycosidase family protein, partial [Clostridia bacterium]|nr:phosphodiester glycosidase family protein [Clostridia bacterium]
HADVAGWAGDIVDLISDTSEGWVDGLEQAVEVTGTVEEMVATISQYYLCDPDAHSEEGAFSSYDMQADLDGFYFMNSIDFQNYTAGQFYSFDASGETMEIECGDITVAFLEYYTEQLNDVYRAEYYLQNRLGTTGTREELRNAVYTEYTSNKVIATLEGTRVFGVDDITDLRIACCYAFADYMCKLAGDYVEYIENNYYTVFNTEYSTLAPGITQTLKQVTTADGQRMAYYIATADVTREDVSVYANYGDNDPSKGWQMQTVEEQMRAAQANNADVENFNIIAGVNGSGFDMSNGAPIGLLVMDGVEYSGINGNGFFGIDDEGNAVIGTKEEYNTIYKGKIKEAVSGFATFLIRDGEIITEDNSSRAPRTAVGITVTGKVVLLVVDGRQEPVSCGASFAEVAQILYDAGCVQAVNLDGGGSSTYVAKQEGADDFAVANKPSDGYARSVSTSLYVASTAPSSTAFDHAIISSDYDYATENSVVNLTAKGVSATGNEAELPEGVYWAVDNEKNATITSEGVLTALKNNETVEVYLMLGDEILATKTITITDPTSIYFARTSAYAIYGEEYTLPLLARYGNKKMAFNADDVTFSLSGASAGTIDGFTFVGNEASNIKNVVITATMNADDSVSTQMTLTLNRLGEATFDFENATGGDRLLAWNREVSNATTEDDINYQIIDENEDMTATYAFAIDMTQLEIPERLQDIVYMLPGANVEGASAWTFLLQLAERISALTTVSTTVKIDENFDVDYSEVNLVSDYFKLSDIAFDEETNTLKVNLGWIKQTQAIDADSANPLCIVSGIKVTPKEDADWGENEKFDAVITGQIDYKIYLRANALYTFATKPENQESFGLYPFVNPEIETEKGGYFESVHATFEDKYSLSRASVEGWVLVEGGFAYYRNNERLTGIHKIDGYYYDFGENGVNVGKTKYNGLAYDEDLQAYCYTILGEPVSGWQQIGDDWYHFNELTYTATTGEVEFFGGVVYTFEETGKLTSGVWAPTLYGQRYYYGPSYYRNGWYNIDGKDYCFDSGIRLEAGCQIVEESNAKKIYYFNEDASCDRNYDIPDGFYTDKNGTFYSKDGQLLYDLQYIDGKYYYFRYTGYAQNNGTYSGRLFKEDYAAYTGLHEVDGTLYYYENGRTGTCGLIELDGDYYYVYWGGVVKTDGKYYVDTTFCDLPIGNYEIGSDGKLLNGVIDKEGILYYYINGKPAEYGLHKDDNGDYYYTYWNGVLKTDGRYYVDTTHCDLPVGNYTFGKDGKMLNGIVEQDGQLYNYINGTTSTCGLYKIGDDYYYAYWGGVVKSDGRYYVDTTFCDLPIGNYTFGPDGKMLDGVVEQNGKLYLYINGTTASYGLYKIGDDYYYSYWGGVLRTDGKYYAGLSYCDLPEGNYMFGPDGKMLNGIVEQDGTLYYYKNGVTGTCGLIKIDNDYYYVYWGGVVKTNGRYYVDTTFCDLPVGNYSFGADGKMLDGIVEKDGVLYYYENGQNPTPGLVEHNGYYYFVNWGGKLVTNQRFYVWEGNGYTVPMNYYFDEQGRVML